MLCIMGCSDELAVREYSVAKRQNALASSSVGQAVEQQILGVIVPRGESAWYFKMMDDPKKLEKHEADFRLIVEKVRFEASGEPQFELSEGWTKEEVRSVVFARLKNNADGVIATVTQLSAPTEDESSWRESVFANVNRWRDQLSLSPMDWERMEPELEELPILTQGNAKAYFVSLVGKKSAGGGMGSALFMNQGAGAGVMPGQPTSGQRPPSGAPAGQSANTPSSSGPVSGTPPQPGPTLSYIAPEGWSELAASGIRRAVFSIEDGQGEPLSVIVSTASVKPEAMVDMWLEQVGKEATDEARQQVAEQTQTESVNDVESLVYEVNGAEGDSILVARIPWTEQEALFVKITGKTERLDAQRAAFMQLVKSMKW